MLDLNTVLQNRYLIVRKIGQGGMGAVYEAQDQRLGITVALKETIVGTDQLRRAFEREARLLAKLRHPALPVVSDHFIEGSGQYLVMQYIPGTDLGELLTLKGNPFTVPEVLRWADQLLDALDYLHSQQPQIIHRDIKPNNLKLTERNEIILLDFGLAKGSPQQTQIDSVGVSIYGYTPHYAPLEQMEGTGTDERSDLYALAATLYHLSTGNKPADAMSRALKLVNGQPDPLKPADQINPQLPRSYAQVLQIALSQNRNERPTSAKQFRNMLRDLGPLSNRSTNAVADQTSEQPTLKMTAGGWNNQNANTTPATSVPATGQAPPARVDSTIPQTTEAPKPTSTPSSTPAPTAGTVPVLPSSSSPQQSANKLLLGIGAIVLVAIMLAVGGVLFWLSHQPPGTVTIGPAMDGSAGSKDKNHPTELSALDIVGAGLTEDRYYAFTAPPGEIKVTLNVVATGATFYLEMLDSNGQSLSFQNNSKSFSLAANGHNEQASNILLLDHQQRVIIHLSNNYPKDLKAYRVRLSGQIELANALSATPSPVVKSLSQYFLDRDNPQPLTRNELIARGSDKDLYYSFTANPGEINFTLNLIANGATVYLELFDSEAQALKFDNGANSFSLAASNHNEQASALFRNSRKQTVLMRITYAYPNDLTAYRLKVSGPVELSKSGGNQKNPESLAKLFADRDNPTALGTRELLGRNAEKDLYYKFSADAGELKFILNVVANGGTVYLELFDSENRPLKFNDNAISFAVASSNHNEQDSRSCTITGKQNLLLRITNAYPNDTRGFRLKIAGPAQLANPDANANHALQSVADLFNDRDNPLPLTDKTLTGHGNEKDLYFLVNAGPGELKLKLKVEANGSTVYAHFFDSEGRTIKFQDGNAELSNSATGTATEKSGQLTLDRKQPLLMRISNTYPNDLKNYQLDFEGALDTSK